MLIDLHTHTAGISWCCQVPAERGLALAKERGFDGVAVTNHYTAPYFANGNYDEWIERYIAEWAHCRELGAKIGLRVFRGVEVSLEEDVRLHMLIYGADEAFLRRYPRLCDYRLPELYAICRAEGCALVQAHPFRGGTSVQNPAFLDGVEINCHPLYGRCDGEAVLAVAGTYGLAVTAGCDYHGDTYRPFGGMHLPEDVTDEKTLAAYLLSTKECNLQIHRPEDEQIVQVTFRRP